MCMLFGFTADKSYNINPVLKTFFKHSERHSDGWGMGYYKDGNSIVVKEPVRALDSDYLKSIRKLEVNLSIAHIRKATKGSVQLSNTHPFVRKIADKNWIFAHNGSIDNIGFRTIQNYLSRQNRSLNLHTSGDTDSEMALELLRLYIGNETTLKGQIESIEKYLQDITKYGKVNLVFTDGKRLYIHTNMAGTLWIYKKNGLALFSTEILERVNDRAIWEAVPMSRLLVYEDGELIHEGRPHDNEYVTILRASGLYY